MPNLGLDLSTELRQEANRFEFWRLFNRKLDLPREDTKFHLETDMRGLAKTNCKDFYQTYRFLIFVERKAKE